MSQIFRYSIFVSIHQIESSWLNFDQRISTFKSVVIFGTCTLTRYSQINVWWVSYFCCRQTFYIDFYGSKPGLFSGVLQNCVISFVYELIGLGKLYHKNDPRRLALLDFNYICEHCIAFAGVNLNCVWLFFNRTLSFDLKHINGNCATYFNSFKQVLIQFFSRLLSKLRSYSLYMKYSMFYKCIKI